MERAVIFDMDDTLYAERDYVLSGFRAVAQWADDVLGIPSAVGFDQLRSLFASGVRGDTFNHWLKGWSIPDDAVTVQQLVGIYRSHWPDITPFAEVQILLKVLADDYRLGLLSDGYLDVQRRKLDALGLVGAFNVLVFSDEWGRKAWKPSIKPFEMICERLAMAPEDAVYIGDNPTKDFAGARAIGMKTTWIKRPDGEYTALRPPSAAYAPDETILSLTALPQVLERIFGRKLRSKLHHTPPGGCSCINKAYGHNTMKIPMSSPDFTQAEKTAVQQVLDTSYLSIGPQLKLFEAHMASSTDTKYAAGVNSGTSGLHLCVIVAGIGEGDLVLTTPFSFIASANSILYERAVPIFVDVDLETGNIDPRLAAEASRDLTQGGEAARRWLPPALRDSETASGSLGRLKGLLPVHAFGQPADMDPLLDTARTYDLAVIEDACEALGAAYKGRQAGTLSDAAVFAFYPNKQITTGEGGMIVTDNEAWANLFRSLRNQGRDVFDAWLNHTRLGYNYRLDEMSAALGLVQIGRLEELLTKRAQVAAWYNERLADLELVQRPVIVPTTTQMSWFVYVVRIMPPADRNAVMERLAEEAIPSRPYFTPIHLQPFYRDTFGYQRGDFPVTEYLGDVSLALPFSSMMTEAQVDRVCEVLSSVLN